MSLADVLKPATALAREGFKVDKTFNQQTDDNAERFNTFTSTRKLFLRHGKAPKVGSVLRNPDLADTYDLLAERGMGAFYRGDLARELAKTVRKPPKSGRTDLPVPKGKMRAKDLAKYDVIQHRPTHVSYRGLDVYGMPPSSSGGTTVGEALNILERYDLKSLTPAQVQHLVIEAAHLAFADRAKYVGDQSGVPVGTLLSDTYAAERACKINPLRALSRHRSRRATSRRPTATAPRPTARARPRRTPRASTPPTSPSPTRTATSSSTRSPSSRPAAPGSCCPAAASCSTTS